MKLPLFILFALQSVNTSGLFVYLIGNIGGCFALRTLKRGSWSWLVVMLWLSVAASFTAWHSASVWSILPNFSNLKNSLWDLKHREWKKKQPAGLDGAPVRVLKNVVQCKRYSGCQGFFLKLMVWGRLFVNETLSCNSELVCHFETVNIWTPTCVSAASCL